jgi:sulfide:quinone oxidoreductase
MNFRQEPLRVAVAGGGVAAAELVLALRALAGDRVAIEIVTPNPQFAFRPASPGAAVRAHDVDVYDLRGLASEAGAALRVDSVEAVARDAHRLRLASGDTTAYDVLVVATGVQSDAGVTGAVTFRDQRDAALVAEAVEALAGMSQGRLVFAAPGGTSWTLPLYELALLAAADLARPYAPIEVTVVTPERKPLEVFGADASRHVAQLLEDHDVRLLAGTSPVSVQHGRLVLVTGESIPADRVLAVPRLVGRRLAGMPADWNGFVDVDERGQVRGVPDVYAAGDVTSYPVKQGGLAAQQADVVAAGIAARAGADVGPLPFRGALRAALDGPDGFLQLRAELDETGKPLDGGSAWSEPGDDGPAAGKLFAKHLGPWLAARSAPTVRSLTAKR